MNKLVSFTKFNVSSCARLGIYYRSFSSGENAALERQRQQKKIWQALNEKDEAERCQIAGLLASVNKETKANSGTIKENHVESAKKLFSIPKTVNEVSELLEDFLNHKNPDFAFISKLLKESNSILEKESNIIKLPKLDSSMSLQIVGDIHGDLEDLHTILKTTGWPSDNNIIVFNGDFVDRGNSGVEVICVLLSLKLLFPNSVHLIRGNHEDSNLGKAYGFFDEVYRKYKSKNLYNDIEKCFSYFPICALYEGELFVAHGGIPGDLSVTLDDIEKIPRKKFKEVVKSDKHQNEKHQSILEDLLWSDPDPYSNGSTFNTKRKAGCLFGNDHAVKWLKSIDVKTLVRSHECKEDGYEEINCDDDDYKIFTVFSSSNYSHGYNLGAVLKFNNSNFRNPEILQFEAPEPRSIEEIENFNVKTIKSLVCKSARKLRYEFDYFKNKNESSAIKNTLIPISEWNTILSRVLGVDIDWKDAISIDSFCKDDNIDYQKFLNEFVSDVDFVSSSNLELFENHDELAAIFKIFDIEEDGRISQGEFIKACNLLNHYLPKDKQVSSVQLFEQADANKNGFVDYEEFCSLFNKKE